MKQVWISIRAKLVFTILCGVAYPALITLIANVFFAGKSSGSLVTANGKVIGSELLAQEFKQDKYFWPRPSAVSYNPIPSGGTNLGPTSKVLLDRVEADRKKGVSGEMLYTSGSGLDPHLSPDGALLQVDRVAKARHLSSAEVANLVNRIKEGRQFGFLGEERVNVMKMNLALDGVRPLGGLDE